MKTIAMRLYRLEERFGFQPEASSTGEQMEKRAHFLGERGERPQRNGVTYLTERLGWRFGLPLDVNSTNLRRLDSAPTGEP
jgi:hypothetical protein